MRGRCRPITRRRDPSLSESNLASAGGALGLPYCPAAHLIESHASGTSMVDMRLKMYRIIEAIHSTVPEEMWPEILRKVDGDETQAGGGARSTFELNDCYDADDFDGVDG